MKDEFDEIDVLYKQMKTYYLKAAPVWRRIVSYIIDYIFLQFVLFILFYTVYGKEITKLLNNIEINNYSNLNSLLIERYNVLLNYFDTNKLQISFASFVVYLSYFSLCWSYSGKTIGGSILKIGVISIDGNKPFIIQSIIRYIVLSFCGMTFYIPLLINFNKILNQRLHDLISATVVVEIPKKRGKDDDNTENKDEDSQSDEYEKNTNDMNKSMFNSGLLNILCY